jgi:aspartyl-tRNA(Asn)/glutamyl-tRNA(Gln) amidotransferase subunit C
LALAFAVWGGKMAMDIEQVRWVAHLARLELSNDELSLIAKQLGSIIEYVNQLQCVDTGGVEPLAHPFAVENVFREDKLGTSLKPDEALENAPKRDGDYFSVPKVLD